MVLPLIIGGAVIAGIAVVAWKSSDAIAPAIYRLFTDNKNRDLDYEKEKQDFAVSKRGVWGNTYAFFFGEEAYAQSFDDKAPSANILLGEEKQTKLQYTHNKFSNRKSARHTDG